MSIWKATKLRLSPITNRYYEYSRMILRLASRRNWHGQQPGRGLCSLVKHFDKKSLMSIIEGDCDMSMLRSGVQMPLIDTPLGMFALLLVIKQSWNAVAHNTTNRAPEGCRRCTTSCSAGLCFNEIAQTPHTMFTNRTSYVTR